MELLIAVLIALGVVANGDADKLAQNPDDVTSLIEKNNVTQAQIDEYELSIIEMEDSDM